MVKLTIYDSGKRPELPTDPSTAAHWVITEMKTPNPDEAYMGDYNDGTTYKEEWKNAFWHVDCKPFDEYVRRALAKAIPHKTPRVDIDLPAGLEKAFLGKGLRFTEDAVEKLIGVLDRASDDLELNLILSESLHPGGLLARVTQVYASLAD